MNKNKKKILDALSIARFEIEVGRYCVEVDNSKETLTETAKMITDMMQDIGKMSFEREI